MLDPEVNVCRRAPESLIEQINTVCAEKRVPRNLFVETYIEFLINGDPNIYSTACRPSEEILDLLTALDKAASPAGKGR